MPLSRALTLACPTPGRILGRSNWCAAAIPALLTMRSSSSSTATRSGLSSYRRVVCHDIVLGQTALVDLAGLRDAIAAQGRRTRPRSTRWCPVQLIVDHSLAVECGGFDPDALARNRDRGSPQRGPLPLHRLVPSRRSRTWTSSRRATASCTRSIWRDVAGRLRAGRRGLPRHLRGHRQPHPARRCAGRDRHGRGRPGGREPSMLGRAVVDAPARHRWRGAHRPAPAGHHRHRHRAGADPNSCAKSAWWGAYRRIFWRRLPTRLSIGDRATISNMCPEYGATAAMFCIDAADSSTT